MQMEGLSLVVMVGFESEGVFLLKHMCVISDTS